MIQRSEMIDIIQHKNASPGFTVIIIWLLGTFIKANTNSLLILWQRTPAMVFVISYFGKLRENTMWGFVSQGMNTFLWQVSALYTTHAKTWDITKNNYISFLLFQSVFSVYTQLRSIRCTSIHFFKLLMVWRASLLTIISSDITVSKRGYMRKITKKHFIPPKFALATTGYILTRLQYKNYSHIINLLIISSSDLFNSYYLMHIPSKSIYKVTLVIHQHAHQSL